MLLAGGVALLAGCNPFGSTYSYRYKITVEVDTPEGLKSGFAVHETLVSKSNVDLGDIDAKRGMRTRGEAVAVDLSGGQTLFALIPDSSLTQAVLDPDWKNDWVESAKRISGGDTPAGALPMDPAKPVGRFDKPSGYPMLVRFRDSADPKTVEEVKPDDLAASFGAGVRLRRIILQMTDEDVTVGIEKKLPSFGKETGFDDWFRGLPYGDARAIEFENFRAGE
jgi:hypothetical protein